MTTNDQTTRTTGLLDTVYEMVSSTDVRKRERDKSECPLRFESQKCPRIFYQNTPTTFRMKPTRQVEIVAMINLKHRKKAILNHRHELVFKLFSQVDIAPTKKKPQVVQTTP